MDIIKWKNHKGQTLVLTPEEAKEVLSTLAAALDSGYMESEHFEIEIHEKLE